MTIDELTTKWLPVVIGDARSGDGSEPAAPVKPVWRRLLVTMVWMRALRRVLLAKGLMTQAEWDQALTFETDALDAELTTRFGV